MYNDAEEFAAASAVVTELKELPGVSAAVVDRLRRDSESSRLSR